MTPAKPGVELIAEERARQIHGEHWSASHDDQHRLDELARAAACYAIPHRLRNHIKGRRIQGWPSKWAVSYWKPSPDDRIRELVKAGALIAAEIDRLQRRSAPGGGS